jgi:hypothetical protein
MRPTAASCSGRRRGAGSGSTEGPGSLCRATGSSCQRARRVRSSGHGHQRHRFRRLDPRDLRRLARAADLRALCRRSGAPCRCVQADARARNRGRHRRRHARAGKVVAAVVRDRRHRSEPADARPRGRNRHGACRAVASGRRAATAVRRGIVRRRRLPVQRHVLRQQGTRLCASAARAVPRRCVRLQCLGPHRGQRVRRCGDAGAGNDVPRRPAALLGAHAARLSRRAGDRARSGAGRLCRCTEHRHRRCPQPSRVAADPSDGVLPGHAAAHRDRGAVCVAWHVVGRGDGSCGEGGCRAFLARVPWTRRFRRGCWHSETASAVGHGRLCRTLRSRHRLRHPKRVRQGRRSDVRQPGKGKGHDDQGPGRAYRLNSNTAAPRFARLLAITPR